MTTSHQLKFDVDTGKILYLESGSLTCLYEHGTIRYVRFGEREVIRKIYSAVRDDKWNTAPYEVSHENVQQLPGGFNIRYVATFHMNDIHYEANVEVQARENKISFIFDGVALSDFTRNRIGICLLHTIEAIVEQEVLVTRPSGETYTQIFPRIISPHQPVKEIRRMKWNAGNCEVEVSFSGDVFETEDQRNWSDSSFKTYSTPLDLPMPVIVKKGDRVKQSVELVFVKAEASVPENSKAPSESSKKPFPAVGFCKAQKQKLTAEQVSALGEILFDHYRVELDLSSAGWPDEFRHALEDARKLNTLLELVLIFGTDIDAEVKALMSQLDASSHLVKSILPLEGKSHRTNSDLLQRVYKYVKKDFPEIQIGYGTSNHFADLNRNMPGAFEYDFVSFGLTPQAHSTDTISLLENLDNQRDDLDTIRHHLGNSAVHVSPVTFKARKPTLFAEGSSPADYDARQHTELGAAWVLKTLRNFAGTHVTLFDAAGYKGILSDSHFTSRPSPVYEVFKILKQFKPANFIVGDKDETVLILENKHGDMMKVELDEMFAQYRQFRRQQ
jgi:hypothetical protein